MKRKVQNILMFFLIIFSYPGKNNQEKNNIKAFDLKEFPKITQIKLSDLKFFDVEYIALETNDNCLIQGINDIKFGNGFFLTHFFTSIIKFQNDGSFVTKIGTIGRGPNEFTVIHDLEIDKKNHNIYLVSGWQKKFFIYTESGDLLRTFTCPMNTTSFEITGDGILGYNINSFGNVETSYNLINPDGEIIKSFPNRFPWNKIQTETRIFQGENLFYQFNNQVFKKEAYSDTVFVFKNLVFKPYLVIEAGKRLINTKARSELRADIIAENFISPMNLFEFGDYIYYEFILKHTWYSYIGSKKNDFQVLINSEQGLINDLDGGPNIWPKAVKDDNTIISWVDAIKLKAHVASEAFKNSKPKYPDKKIELQKLANSLKETDNPVLILVSLKK